MTDLRITSLVPLSHVADMTASIAFYRKLGFTVANQVTPDGETVPNWALLESGRAALMLARAGATTFVFGRIRTVAAWLLVPYLVWTSFAGVLTWRVLQLNPNADGLVCAAGRTQIAL